MPAVRRVGAPSALSRTRDRGTLRVGYNADRIPLPFFHSRQELVGFDVDLAGLLTRDIGVTLELVPFTRHDMAQQLSAGTVGIIPSLAYNTAWIGDIRFSISYHDAVLGLAV